MTTTRPTSGPPAGHVDSFKPDRVESHSDEHPSSHKSSGPPAGHVDSFKADRVESHTDEHPHQSQGVEPVLG